MTRPDLTRPEMSHAEMPRAEMSCAEAPGRAMSRSAAPRPPRLRRVGGLPMLAVGLAALVAACAAPAPVDPGPAARFEGGGGQVREVTLSQAEAARLIGEWIGTYRQIDMSNLRVAPETGGRALMIIDQVDGNILRGGMEWDPVAGEQAPRDWVGALTLNGHFMAMNAHAILYTQDGVEFLEIDLMLDDGRFHRHRLTRR